ncbi:16S rRNA (guanine(527)-N(7))-methyltransferase RsmG [Pararhizobium mangrovi]|uniref:Ribosomal RNA small subunit methyltransferase G n=1 Tax=Pararhizobium mangrovi TaxID=2590452 RepID=A0A506U1X7_9HYPH|nr:16S rRNA (guanine(527)-N(7))-methyltransferase RsmG [Pararhizobium mangrovi]TPW27271.1 16S rRNA (guanine(527)-N(7))-methyltransferase RsmG [Pararhizobium mangrovi]
MSQAAFDVSRETQTRLDRFLALFAQWSARMNLVSASTRNDVVERHVADSLQLYRLVGTRQWLDLGSGAGFPGLIVAIALAERNEGWVDLVESNRKKAAFLRVAVLETGARASVHDVRAEAMIDRVPDCDAVSSRALAPLDQLLGLAEPWLCKGTRTKGWFHKGRDHRSEVSKARGSWQFDLVEHPSRIDRDSVILQIANLKRL